MSKWRIPFNRASLVGGGLDFGVPRVLLTTSRRHALACSTSRPGDTSMTEAERVEMIAPLLEFRG